VDKRECHFRAAEAGLWSAAAFQRAIQEGISRGGRYLYPAFPYDHFTKVVARDDEALYAYLMSRPPDSVQVHVIPRPGQPFFGAGEAALGPAAGASSNAVANAIGTRVRDIPFTRDRVMAALRQVATAPPYS
jgi:hypothetical protein